MQRTHLELSNEASNGVAATTPSVYIFINQFANVCPCSLIDRRTKSPLKYRLSTK